MKILPVLRHVVPSLAAIGNDVADPGSREVAYDRNPLHALHSQTHLWADVVAHLDRVTQPLLVFRSEQDHVVDPSSLAILKAAGRLGRRGVPDAHPELSRRHAGLRGRRHLRRVGGVLHAGCPPDRESLNLISTSTACRVA